jgi:hypothetical protein
MPNTMTLINSSTVGSGGASEIEFTSIPGTYTDLVLLISPRSASTGGSTWRAMVMRFNNSTSGYKEGTLAADGLTVFSFSNAGGTDEVFIGDANMGNNVANAFSNHSIYITNYTANAYKSIIADSVQGVSSSQGQMDLIAGIWENTAAITSIKVYFLDASNFVQHSTAYLYGIKKD